MIPNSVGVNKLIIFGSTFRDVKIDYRCLELIWIINVYHSQLIKILMSHVILHKPRYFNFCKIIMAHLSF